MKLIRHFASLAAVAAVMLLTLSACSGMSKREKSMIGKYYLQTISDTHPLIELNDKNQAVVRAIRPGELSYSVTGTWHVEEDSLIITTDPSSITIEEGDPSLVGSVAPRLAYPIIQYDEITLRLQRQGAVYDYHRRPE